jgi:hypothetical protein
MRFQNSGNGVGTRDKRAVPMQASLALVRFLAGMAAWLMGGSILWLVGALLIGAVVPVTFFVIMPVNPQRPVLQRDAVPRRRGNCWNAGEACMEFEVC